MSFITHEVEEEYEKKTDKRTQIKNQHHINSKNQKEENKANKVKVKNRKGRSLGQAIVFHYNGISIVNKVEEEYEKKSDQRTQIKTTTY